MGTCHTPNVIYILNCKFRDAFYVGETGCALNIRINNHRHSVLSTNRMPQSPYTPSESHNTNFDLSFLFAIIHILPLTTSTSIRRLWESAFIHDLNSKMYSDLSLQ